MIKHALRAGVVIAVFAAGLASMPTSPAAAASVGGHHAAALPARPSPGKVSPTNITLTHLYRMWNGAIADHFYTTSWNEVLSASSQGWSYEGISCDVSTTDTGQPLYRMWNPTATDHFYTSSWDEVISAYRQGWGYEGIVGYLGGPTPLFRMWNGPAADHFYTTSWNEVLSASRQGWGYEGLVGYCW